MNQKLTSERDGLSSEDIRRLAENFEPVPVTDGIGGPPIGTVTRAWVEADDKGRLRLMGEITLDPVAEMPEPDVRDEQ